MKILLASDHAGFELKKKIFLYLKERGFDVVDCGPDEFDPDDDYPDFVALVAEGVSSDQTGEVRGIVIGGSGQGEAMVANRFSHVRAAVFNGQYEPRDGRKTPNEIIISREHNDSNILSLGARFLSETEAIDAVKLWLDTAFPREERHVRRIKKIDELTQK